MRKKTKKIIVSKAEPVKPEELIYDPVRIEMSRTIVERVKTISYRGTEKQVTDWMNGFCADKLTHAKHVSVTSDGRAFVAFVSYLEAE